MIFRAFPNPLDLKQWGVLESASNFEVDGLGIK